MGIAAVVRVLGLGAMDSDELARRTQPFNRSLATRSDVTLLVANALWIDTSATLRADSANRAHTFFDASTRALPLASKVAADAVNHRADSTTRGRITRLRDAGFAENAKVVLTNVVYLKGTWLTRFNKRLPRDREFAPATGPSARIPAG